MSGRTDIGIPSCSAIDASQPRRLEVHEHRATGVRHVRGVHAPREVPQQPRVDCPERQLGRIALDVVEDPAQLQRARVRRHRQAGGRPVAIDLPDAGDGIGRPRVLPDDRVMDGPTSAPVPYDGGLPLVADADRGERARIDAGLAQRDPHARQDALEDLVGVVLDPARARRDLLVLELMARDRVGRRGRTGCIDCWSCPGRWPRSGTAAGGRSHRDGRRPAPVSTSCSPTCTRWVGIASADRPHAPDGCGTTRSTRVSSGASIRGHQSKSKIVLPS